MEYIAGAIMSSNLVSITEKDKIDRGINLMRQNNIRHLPVVNAKNELTGIVSLVDLIKESSKNKSIYSVMQKNIRSVQKTDNIKLIIELMLRDKIKSVLVVDSSDVVGIITTDDLLRLLSRIVSDYENREMLLQSLSIMDETWIGARRGT